MGNFRHVHGERVGIFPDRASRRAQIDAGARPRVTSVESDQIKRLKRENFELRRANEILKVASTFFAAELDRPQRYSWVFIESHNQTFGVVPICSVLSEHGCPIAPSTYYEARHRSLSIRAAQDEDLKAKISVAHGSNFSVYGARKGVAGPEPSGSTSGPVPRRAVDESPVPARGPAWQTVPHYHR